ncbi:MAG TPA: DUF1592 domain-containing protein [Polyangia bacterium]
MATTPLLVGALTLSACVGSIDPNDDQGTGGSHLPNANDPRGNGSGYPSGGSSGNSAIPSGSGAPITGTIPSAPGPSSMFVRLSHLQWENSVRDLLRLPKESGLSQGFLAEPLRSTFDNSGGTLEITSQLWANYHRAADQLAKDVAKNAAHLALLLPTGAPTDLEGRARAFIRNFGKRAYRRPLSDAEIEQHLTLFKQGPTLVASGDPFVDGIELVLAAMLQSPHFLHRTEIGAGTASNGKVLLTDHEIAARLSYALTNSMPDDALLAAADEKRAHTTEAVLDHAKRLLESPAGKAAMRDLHDQLLRDVDPTDLLRDPTGNPAFKPGMGQDMKKESQLFVEDVVFTRGAGLKELLTAPHSFVNDRLAALYGVSVPAGGGFAKVALNPTERAGLYTQLGFLARTSNDKSPQPILRGVHINRHVLCVGVPPPPPTVDTMVSHETMGPATNRQVYEQLTSPIQCQGCHAGLINPIGFAFENFDNLGRFQRQEGTLPINAAASYTFTEGKRDFDGAAALMRAIADGQQAHDCYARQLFAYLYARDVKDGAPGDQALLAEIARRSRLDASVKSLVLDLVATDAFIHRLP